MELSVHWWLFFFFFFLISHWDIADNTLSVLYKSKRIPRCLLLGEITQSSRWRVLLLARKNISVRCFPPKSPKIDSPMTKKTVINDNFLELEFYLKWLITLQLVTDF